MKINEKIKLISLSKYILIYLLVFITPMSSYAIEDNLFKSLQVSSHGTKFQSARMKIAAENLANEDSVSITPGGDPYRRKVVYPKNYYDRKLKTHLVKIRKYGHDKTPFKKVYNPNHPGADAQGYLKLPNIDKIIEKADANEAQRSHEANLGMMEISKHMINKTIEAMR